MKRVNAMVLAVSKPRVASDNTWEVKVGYAVDCQSITFRDYAPVKKEVLPEGIVTWVKPDDEIPGRFVIGINNPKKKAIKRRSVFMNRVPEIGTWMEVCFV